MPSELLLSVVIPAYNASKTLTRAVSSVLDQAGEEVELLVIDDGSTDETPKVLAALKKQYGSRIQNLYQENGGPAKARNHGIRLAKGRFILPLDADDELMPKTLPILSRHLYAHPEMAFGLAGHLKSRIDGTTRQQLPPPNLANAPPLQRLRAYLIQRKFSIGQGFSIFSREFLRRCPYPEHLWQSEDAPVFARALIEPEIKTLPFILARIHARPDSLRHDPQKTLSDGLTPVEAVFLELPPEMQRLKPAYRRFRQLEIFRTCMLTGDAQNALQYWEKAVREDWRTLFAWPYTRKALRLYGQRFIPNSTSNKRIF